MKRADRGAGRWSHFSHRADIGVEGEGFTLAEAFQQAAMALTAVVTDPADVRPVEPVEVSCQAPDVEMLFVDWLNALIYEMAVRRMLFSRFDVVIAGETLSGRAWGEPVDRERHQPAVEIKGATYTGLEVGRTKAGDWVARCVVDV